MTFPQVLQALAELLELAILIVPADSGNEIYLQLTRDLLGIALVVDEVLDHVLVEFKDVVIVSDSLDGDVLVHELDCLGPERCPDELPAIVYRSHGIVDLREPDEIGLVGSHALEFLVRIGHRIAPVGLHQVVAESETAAMAPLRDNRRTGRPHASIYTGRAHKEIPNRRYPPWGKSWRSG